MPDALTVKAATWRLEFVMQVDRHAFVYCGPCYAPIMPLDDDYDPVEFRATDLMRAVVAHLRERHPEVRP